MTDFTLTEKRLGFREQIERSQTEGTVTDSRISQKQIVVQALEISRDGEVLGAVWKAPSPFNDWYYGRIVLGGESDGTTLLMTLEGCGTGKTQEQAVGALIEWRDGGGA